MKVLIVEDSAIVRDRLAGLVREIASVKVAGLAATGASALILFDALQPAVVILDLGLPDISGVEVLVQIRRRAVPCAVIILTAFGSPEVVQRCLQLGADYVCDKATEFECAIDALQALANTATANSY